MVQEQAGSCRRLESPRKPSDSSASCSGAKTARAAERHPIQSIGPCNKIFPCLLPLPPTSPSGRPSLKPVASCAFTYYLHPDALWSMTGPVPLPSFPSGVNINVHCGSSRSHGTGRAIALGPQATPARD
jgi:hypothetical protein